MSDRAAARRRVDDLRRRADAITDRVLHSDEAWIDIEIAINELREQVRARSPDRLWLFDAVYGARWRRLREQGWSRCT